MESETKVRWWWNLPIILLIGVLVPLGVRSLITDDNRYGWGTFSKQVVFRVNYYWLTEDGDKIMYNPGRELSGKVRNKLKRSGSTRYSTGALKSWVNNYTRYTYLNKRPNPDFKSFRAEIYYKINSLQGFHFREGSNELIIEYPTHSGE